jgi:hypothetical protein
VPDSIRLVADGLPEAIFLKPAPDLPSFIELRPVGMPSFISLVGPESIKLTWDGGKIPVDINVRVTMDGDGKPVATVNQ